MCIGSKSSKEEVKSVTEQWVLGELFVLVYTCACTLYII